MIEVNCTTSLTKFEDFSRKGRTIAAPDLFLVNSFFLFKMSYALLFP
jgi:hypothetical protein